MTKNIQAFVRDYDLQSPKRLHIKDIPEDSSVFNGDSIFEFFLKGSSYTSYKEYEGTERVFEGFTAQNLGHWNYIFDKCLADLAEIKQSEGSGEQSSNYVERWWETIKKVFRAFKHSQTNKQSTQDFFVFIKHDEILIDKRLNLTKDQINLKRRSSRILGFWCFNAGLGFKRLKDIGPRAIILTSGTLSPLDVFQHELMTPFNIRIQNTHVVTKE